MSQLVKYRGHSKASLQLDPRAHSLAALVEGFAGEWSAWELANVSCAELALGLGSPAFFTEVEAAFERHRGEVPNVAKGDMSTQELLMVTRAFIQAGFFDVAFFDAVAAAVAGTAHHFSARGLSEMSWALGRAFQTFSVESANAAHALKPDAVPKSHRDALGGHVHANPLRSAAFAAMAGRCRRLSGEMRCMDVSNTLYGFACAGVHDRELLELLAARTARIAAQMSENLQARDTDTR
ncbi:hypothetical protein WJX81_002700 [Elliptochloris bilobata]|uniref:Uncharacterized protein n=1 Tax=Elliptochloris bilobata TaxID=381761 RepID=A0AAW1QN30_9CHLO